MTLCYLGPDHLGIKEYISNRQNDDKVIEISCGYLHSCFITESGKAVHLASDFLSSDSSNAKIIQIPEDEKAKSCACNMEDVFIVTSSGSCFHFNNSTSTKCIFKADSQSKASKIITGGKHNIFLMQDGGLCSVGPTLTVENIFPKVKVSEVSCGQEHVLILVENGLVLSYGSGSRGQLGHGDLIARNEPEALEALEGLKVQAVQAGGWHSAALSCDGDLYLWGWNESCQLGLPRSGPSAVHCQALPKLLECPDILSQGSEADPPLLDFKAVSCGSRHTVAIDVHGRAFGWGWTEHKQLGQSVAVEKEKKLCTQVVSRPTLLLPTGTVVSSVKCSVWTTLLQCDH